MTRELESRKDLVDEKVTRHDGNQKKAPSPLAGEGEERSDGGVGFPHNDVCDYTKPKCELSLIMDKYEPRPCGCNTRKLVNNRFPARTKVNSTGWGLGFNNSGTPQSLISSNHFTHFTHLTHLTHFKIAAFTLAETLITLGVIGIVAAMTIPTLINNYQEKVTVTKVKKMYSTLNQAVKLAEVDNGSVITWDLPAYDEGGSQKLYGYLKPYLKVSKECVEDNSGNCLDTNTNYYYLNGSEWNSPRGEYGGKDYVRIILADGAVLWFRSKIDNKSQNARGILGQFWYDVNGSSKPNTYGKDIFSWFITSDSSIMSPLDSCYLNDTGTSCADWVLKHNNMDYPATKPVQE